MRCFKKIFTYCCSIALGAALLAPAALAADPSSPPQVSAGTAIVMDAQTKHIYYGKDPDKQMYPASITKIMTGLLAGERGDPGDVITVSEDVGSSQGESVSCIGLVPGEQISEESLLYTMFLASANDSAYMLAEHIGGTADNFVNMMNARAKQLGAKNTHFSNPNGLPDTNHYTSAYDMALITAQAIKTPGLLTYFGAQLKTIPADNKQPLTITYGTLVNMLRPDSQYYYPGIIASKSGWTNMSGFTLATAAQRDGRTLICVLLGGTSWPQVYTDTAALLDYGFSQPAPVSSAPQANPAIAQVHRTQAGLSVKAPGDGQPSGPVQPLLIVAVVAGVLLCLVAYLTARRFLSRRRSRIFHYGPARRPAVRRRLPTQIYRDYR